MMLAAVRTTPPTFGHYIDSAITFSVLTLAVCVILAFYIAAGTRQIIGAITLTVFAVALVVAIHILIYHGAYVDFYRRPPK